MASSRALRILQVTAPADVGGLESVVLDLSTGLAGLGHRVRLVALTGPVGDSNLFVREARHRGIDVTVVTAGPRGYLAELRIIRRLILNEGPALVHTHGYRADVIGGWAARLAGVPWVTTMHGFTGGGWKNRLYERLQVASSRLAAAVIAVAGPIRDHLVGRGIASTRVNLLPNAVAARPGTPQGDARRRLGLPADGVVIGWVGRLSPEKAPDLFLDALALLPPGPWMASILGDGAMRSSLRLQADRLGLSERIHWHGVVPQAAGLLRAFDVWVLTSRTEGTPLTLLEAMAAQVPAVVTEVGGVPDVVSPGEALLVPPGQPAALAHAIDEVVQHRREAVARSVAALRRVREHYGLAGWLAAHVSVYRRVTDEAFLS